MELTGKKIVFLGDSITEGVGTSDITKGYVYQVGVQGGFRESKNFGISGTRIARQTVPTKDNPRFDLDYCSRAEELDEDADIVVVFGGTNDFGHGDAPIGTFESRELTTFYGACHYLMSRLMERFPGKPVIFITPLHAAYERCIKKNIPEKGVTLKTYVDIIREMAEYYSLPVLDFWADCGIQPALPFNREQFAPDGLHPNDAGNALMTRRILAFLRAL